jgi:hypothetical protein
MLQSIFDFSKDYSMEKSGGLKMAVHDLAQLKRSWKDFHDRFIHEVVNIMIDEALLPQGFNAIPTAQIYVERGFEPDVVVKKEEHTGVIRRSIGPTQSVQPSLRFVATRSEVLPEKHLMLIDDLGEPVAVMEVISPRNRTHRTHYATQYEDYIRHGLTFVMVDLIYFVGENVHDLLISNWKNALPIPDNPEKPLFTATYTPQTEYTVATEVMQFGFRDDFPDVVIEVEGHTILFPLAKAYQTTARRMKLPPV